MSRASTDALDALHGLLAGALKDELQAAVDLSKHEDAEKRRPVPPQLLDKVMKFLKDNGIDSPGRNNKPVSDLAAQLGNLDLDEAASQYTTQ